MSYELERLRSVLAERYHVERELGVGGMATVYLAHDRKHDRPVALKVLKPELALAVGAERFLREIRISAGLNHPHILPLHDSGEAEGVLYFVMPFMRGESLRNRLDREKQLPVDEALQIAREVADALSYAHEHGVVHRDIKPENILLESGHAVVADFGIARAVTSAGVDRLTGTGMSIGTPAYMSPEQVAGSNDVDGRSDLYALGCVLHEMLAGEPPFTGPTVASVVHKHLTMDPPSIALLRPAVPASVAAAVSRSLAKTPADRFSPVIRFAEALTHGQAGTTPAGGVWAFLRPSRVGRGAWFTAAAMGLAATLVMLDAVADAPAGSASAPDRTAIAVLPFEDLGAPGPHEYFAGGLHDEILTQLAKVSSLRVISRTSVMRYEGARSSLSAIAEELGVGSVVEGSVQVVGDRLRVTVQLIDASTDAHLWAERYDRTLEDAFAIQSDIATQIAAAVGAALSGAEQRGLSEAPTENALAYRYYLQGNEYFARGLGDPTILLAARMYESAIALDPDFALAYAGLAKANARAVFQGYAEGEETAGRAEAAAGRALELRPGLPEAHEALGWYHYWVERDWSTAAAHFVAALEEVPNSSDIQLGLGLSRRRLGQWDEAQELLERARDRDPLSSEKIIEVGISHLFARRYPAAVEAFERATALTPDHHRAYAYLAGALIARDANTDAAVEVLRRGARAVGETQFVNRQLDRNTHDEIRWLLPELFPDAFARLSPAELGSRRLPYYLTLAEWHWQYGRYAQQRLYGDSAVAVGPSGDFPLAYARALGHAGRREETLREVGTLLDASPLEGDWREAPQQWIRIARLVAMIGEDRLALEILERWAAQRSEFSRVMLRFDPAWRNLRADPRFQEIAGAP